MRAIRGAITVEENTRAAIDEAVALLVREIVEQNALEPSAIVSAIFTMTDDLTAAFPARAAQRAGWVDVAMLDMKEIAVPGDLAKCIRVMVHVESPTPPQHVYLRRATALRPDPSQIDPRP